MKHLEEVPQILNAMINNDAYKLMDEKNEPHYFLEGFSKKTHIQYGAGFGS